MNQPPALSKAPTSLRNDIRQLGKTLGEVIRECEGKAIYDVIEKLRRAAVKFRREGNPADRHLLHVCRSWKRDVSSVAFPEVSCVSSFS